MAEAIYEGAQSESAECQVLSASDFENMDDVCALAIGASTRMKKPLPMVRRILAELPDLNGMPAAAYGSYGWSGEAPDIIANLLTDKGASLVEGQPIRAKDYPSESILEECKELGRTLAKRCL